MNKDDYKKFLLAYRITTGDKSRDADKVRAFEIWKELADEDYVRSTFYLGVCYDDGIGVGKNLKKAFKNYLLAAQSDHPESQYNVYRMLYRGEGVKKNIKEAVKWLKKAANEGKQVDAIRDLGYHYHEGEHVKKNYTKAVHYYRIAARMNDRIAQWNLGLCYKDGEGVKQSDRWATHWIAKAAKQGHEPALDFIRKNRKRGTDRH